MIRRILLLPGVWTLTPLALASEEGGKGGSALITPEFGTIFWTVVTFVVLLVFLRKVAWKPLLGAIEEREKGIRETLEQARREREEAAKALDEHKRLLTQARQERADAVEAGRKDAERLKAEILDEAKKQSEQRLRQAEEQVATAVRQAQAELRGTVADLTVRAASKLLSKTLDEASHRKLVEEYLDDLERQPGGSASPPS